MRYRTRTSPLALIVILFSAAAAFAGQLDWDHFPSCPALIEELLVERMSIVRVRDDQRKRELVEVRIDELVPIHAIPRLKVPKPDTHVRDLMKTLRENGFWLSHAIVSPP